MALKWTHETTVTVTFPGTDPEERESEDFDVRLYVSGSPATDDYFCKSFGNWLPGDGAEIELLRFGIWEKQIKGEPWIPRKPIPACYPDANDQPVIDAVHAWWDERRDECWESLEEGDDE